jgi:hypothetical protein
MCGGMMHAHTGGGMGGMGGMNHTHMTDEGGNMMEMLEPQFGPHIAVFFEPANLGTFLLFPQVMRSRAGAAPELIVGQVGEMRVDENVKITCKWAKIDEKRPFVRVSHVRAIANH